jgi:hypothetical protein
MATILVAIPFVSHEYNCSAWLLLNSYDTLRATLVFFGVKASIFLLVFPSCFKQMFFRKKTTYRSKFGVGWSSTRDTQLHTQQYGWCIGVYTLLCVHFVPIPTTNNEPQTSWPRQDRIAPSMLQPMNVVHQCNIASLQGGPAHAIGERSAEETTIDPAAEDVAESGLSIPLLSYFKL